MTSDPKEKDEPKVRVTDRRVSQEKPDEKPDDKPVEMPADDAVPPIDFTTFVLSLSTSALAQLGEIPGGGEPARTNLALARQTIDLLGMLEEKTAGNLTGDEERLLAHLLLDLRMRYVTKTKK